MKVLIVKRSRRDMFFRRSGQITSFAIIGTCIACVWASENETARLIIGLLTMAKIILNFVDFAFCRNEKLNTSESLVKLKLKALLPYALNETLPEMVSSTLYGIIIVTAWFAGLQLVATGWLAIAWFENAMRVLAIRTVNVDEIMRRHLELIKNELILQGRATPEDEVRFE